jgi:DNA-binding MarR family transcriptional regulator
MARGRDYVQDEHRESGSRMPAPERAPDREVAEQGSRGGGQGSGPAQPQVREVRSPEAEITRPERRPYREIDRDRPVMLRDSEIRTLAEIGTFRAVTAQDLTRFRYAGDERQAWRDLNNLAREGLIRRRTALPSNQVYLTLTRQGHRFIEAHRPQGIDARQVLYHGFVKPREARHDAALYRLYQEGAAQIARDGGKIHRAVLDFELKKAVYRKLAKVSELPESDQPHRKQEIAEEHGLTVVNGKIPLPDLRIEYETVERDQTKADLELATSDYHRDSLAEKARAGFAIFAMREDAAPLRRAIADPELTRDIFSI